MESVREMHLRMQQEMQQILEDNERLRGSSAVSKHQIAEHPCPRPCCRVCVRGVAAGKCLNAADRVLVCFLLLVAWGQDGEYLRLQQNEASLLQQTEQLASQLRALQQERKEQDDRLQEMEDQCQDLLERQEQLTRELEDNLPAKERAKLTRQIEALKLQNRELKEEQARLLEQQRHHTRQSEQDAACDILKLQAAELQQANEARCSAWITAGRCLTWTMTNFLLVDAQALQTRNRELEMKVELLQRQLAEERAKTNIGLLPSMLPIQREFGVFPSRLV